MRGTTEIWLGIRHTGRKSEADTIESMTMVTALRKMALRLAEVDLAKRLTFVIARSEEEIRREWSGDKSATADSIADELEAMLQEMGEG